MALAAATRFGRQVLLALAIGVAGLAGPGASLESARPLGDRVVIRRDTFGIPHILAETEAAGGFGFGYAQAEDHAAEMAKRFLSARGEAARQFGRSMLEDDFAARRVDNIGEARRALPSVDRTFREVMDGFAEGYNAYVRKHRQTLPPWVIEISAADVLAQSHAGAATAVSAPALANALRRKYPEETSAPSERVDAQTILEECAGEWPVDADGSNAFALSGRKTVSGAPILLGNPHLRWDQLYWEAHVKVPGRLDFYGSTLVGFPWLRAGFNDRLGYVQTNNAPDTSDIFALPLDPQRPDHYRFDGRPHRLERVAVTVEVKADDGTLVTERRSYWRTHLGPIVHRTTTTAFAYRSTALDAWRAFEGFWRLSHARSMKDYVKTMSMRLSPTSNYTYADADGNILYLWNARIPKRPGDGTDYTLDVPGDTKKFVWSKLHPLGDLPQLVNPPSGYVQNANNPPWFVSLGARLDPRRYPSYFERGELALRPQLAVNMLEARGKLSVEDVKRVKFDTRLLLAERVKDDLLAAIAAEAAPSADLAEGGRILAAWDGRSSAESRGGMLFQRFWRTYRAEVQQPFAQRWDEARPFETPRGIAQTKVALVHLAQAVRWARDTYGTADVAWGEANRYRFRDLELPGEGASGELGAFRVQQFEAVPGHAGAVGIAGWAEGDRQLAGFGDAWVLLVHFTRPIQAFSVLAYGQTTDRSSSHSRDQIRVFANRDLRPAWFTEAEIAAHLERSYRPGRE